MRVSKNKTQMWGACKHVTVSITQSLCLIVLRHSTAFFWVANAVCFPKVYFYDSNTAHWVNVFWNSVAWLQNIHYAVVPYNCKFHYFKCVYILRLRFMCENVVHIMGNWWKEVP
jgi:hypothetical protein